jgi:hypothetical protein
VAERAGRGGRIKGADQGRQNAIFYNNPTYLSNFSGGGSDVQLNFPNKLLDLKSGVLTPSSNWRFVAARTRYYFISVWVDFSSLPDTYTGDPVVSYSGSYIISRTYTLKAKVNNVDVTSQLVGQPALISVYIYNGEYLPLSTFTPTYVKTISSASAHIEGLLFLSAGDSLTFTATYNLTNLTYPSGDPGNPTYAVVPLGADAQSYVQVTEITPEA